MQAYNGWYYNGKPVWNRKDYEERYGGKTERQRIWDDYDVLESDNYASIRKLADMDSEGAYRVFDPQYDDKLRGYKSGEDLWEPFNFGWVHKVTNEWCMHKPERDSYPAWCKKEPPRYLSSGEKANREVFGWLSVASVLFAGALSLATGCSENYDDEEEDYDYGNSYDWGDVNDYGE